MSAPIKRYEIAQSYHSAQQSMEVVAYGDYVLHADHLASHAFDEAKERELFEADMGSRGYDVSREPGLREVYAVPQVQVLWLGWARCAKSRAKAAGCAE
jgi:hypothetical protein